MNHYGMGAQITVKYWSLHKCSPSSPIMCWVRPITTELSNGRKTFYLKGIDWKKNFYVVKFMMKPLGIGYQKINRCPNFCKLYYLENAELTECKTCRHARYKPRIGRGMTLIAHKKYRYFTIIPRLHVTKDC